MMDDISFRTQNNNGSAEARLKDLIVSQTINKGDAITQGGLIKIQIEDGFLREYAKNIIQKDFGIVDSSFDRSIISLSPIKFLSLVRQLLSESQQEQIESEISKISDRIPENGKENLWQNFLVGAASGAGREFGKSVVGLCRTALTGGVSEVRPLIEAFTKDLQDPGQGDASGGIIA